MKILFVSIKENNFCPKTESSQTKKDVKLVCGSANDIWATKESSERPLFNKNMVPSF